MLYNTLKFAHVLSIIVWIGGMVFAHAFLRPAAQALEPPQRVRLMHDVLARFLNAVSVAAVVVLGSGLWMIGNVARQAAQTGGKFSMPLGWTVMATLGLVMIAIFGHIRFALFKRLQRAVAAGTECSLLLQQIAALRGAVGGLMAEVLEIHLRETLGSRAGQVIPHEEIDGDLDAVMKILRTYLK